MRPLHAWLLIPALVLASAAQAQTSSAPPRHPIEGVWSKVAGVVDGEVVVNQPGYRMFLGGYYATVRNEGLTPRTAAPATGATAAQVREALQRFTGQAGRYEITSMQTFTERAEVAFSPAAMEPGRYVVQSYRIVGDTLWTTNILTQAGPVAAPQVGKYIRQRNGGATPVDGVWRLVEGRTPSGGVVENQPGYRLFVDGYYSLVRVNGTKPRPALPDASGTAEQLMAAWGPFTSQAGTFEVSGSTITERALVAKGPAVAGPGNFSTRTYRIRGDTLWTTQTANQAGPIKDATTFKYVRARGPRPPTD